MGGDSPSGIRASDVAAHGFDRAPCCSPTNRLSDALLRRLGQGNVAPSPNKSRPARKFWIPNSACAPTSSAIPPSFFRWTARQRKQPAASWPVRWHGPAVFNARLMTTAKTVRALCGVNPFASAYHLNPERNFHHAHHDLGLERARSRRHEPQIAWLGARFRHARRPPDPAPSC